MPQDRSSGDTSAVLLAAREEERRVLADTLHDGLTQTLTAARAYLDAYQLARGRQDEEKEARLLARGLELLDGSVAEVRRVIRDLREGKSDSLPPENGTAHAPLPQGDEGSEHV